MLKPNLTAPSRDAMSRLLNAINEADEALYLVGRVAEHHEPQADGKNGDYYDTHQDLTAAVDEIAKGLRALRSARNTLENLR